MSWSPNDLVSDADLLAYEATLLTTFKKPDFADKRRRAMDDWLAPILRGQGYDLVRLKTRFEPEAVYSYTGSAYTDKTSAARDTTTDDVDLGAAFATAGSDALYIGAALPFRGLSIRLLDTVSSVSSVLTVSYWNDAWSSLAIEDRTAKATGKTFSGGGSVLWLQPNDWVPRTVSTVGPYYWVKLTVSATPTNAKASQIGCIRRSVLAAPLTMRTLLLVMREAPTGASGPWAEKADWYESEADAALQRALPLIGAEFDTDASDQVSTTEAAQSSEEVGTQTPYRLERG